MGCTTRYSRAVQNHRGAVVLAGVLVGSMVAVGCGRFGFDSSTDGTRTSDDEPCVASTSTVSATTASIFDPRLAWNGTKLGVVWLEDETSLSARFRMVALDGTADPITDLGALAQGEAVELAWDGARWRLAWSDEDPNREVMLSTDGAAPQVFTTNGRQDMRVRIAPLADGQVAYLWVVDPPRYNLRLTIVDAAGTKLVDDRSVATAGNLESHNLIWTGSELVAFYSVGTRLMMLRMNRDGSEIAGPVQVAMVDYAIREVSVRWTGDRFLAAWAFSSGGFRVAYVNPDGSLMFPSVTAPASAVFTTGPRVATGPVADAVVWDSISGGTFLAEVSREDGTMLGTLHNFPDAYFPSAAWVDTTWAIAAVQRRYGVPGGPDPPSPGVDIIQICR